MTHLPILFLTASATALLLLRTLLMLGAENRAIFETAVLAAGAIVTLWLIARRRMPGGEAP